VLVELGGEILVGRVVRRQSQRKIEQREGIEGHPPGPIALPEPGPGGQVRAVEGSDVVEAKEAPLEDVGARGILTVDPPGEVDCKLVEDPLEELVVAAAIDRPDPSAA